MARRDRRGCSVATGLWPVGYRRVYDPKRLPIAHFLQRFPIAMAGNGDFLITAEPPSDHPLNRSPVATGLCPVGIGRSH